MASCGPGLLSNQSSANAPIEGSGGSRTVGACGVRPASRRASPRPASAARSARRRRVSMYASSHWAATVSRWSTLASRCAPATASAANSWASTRPDSSAVVADASRGSTRIDHATTLGCMPMRRRLGAERTWPAATARALRPASVNERSASLGGGSQAMTASPSGERTRATSASSGARCLDEPAGVIQATTFAAGSGGDVGPRCTSAFGPSSATTRCTSIPASRSPASS